MPRMGIDGKLYYGAAGATAATEIPQCRDLTQTLEAGEADISGRGCRIALSAPGLVKTSVDWEMPWDDTKPVCLTLQAALLAGTPVAIRTKDHAAGKGWDADFTVLKIEKAEPLEGAQMMKVTVKPTYVTRYPQAYV